MKRKILSFGMALALCMSFTVPMAAEEPEAPIYHPDGYVSITNFLPSITVEIPGHSSLHATFTNVGDHYYETIDRSGNRFCVFYFNSGTVTLNQDFEIYDYEKSERVTMFANITYSIDYWINIDFTPNNINVAHISLAPYSDDEVIEDGFAKSPISSIAIGNPPPYPSVSPLKGTIIDGQWKINVELSGESIDLITLSEVPAVNRKIYIDGNWKKAFPYDVEADFSSDGEFIGERGYGLIEEFTVPVGTVVTYAYSVAGWSAPGFDGLMIEELFLSHTAEDNIDFYSPEQLNEDGSYKTIYDEEIDYYVYTGFTHVFDYSLSRVYSDDTISWWDREQEEKTVSFTFDKVGLYGVHAKYMNITDMTDDVYYFVINVVDTVSEKPSSWAEAQVNTAITHNLVPSNLQSKYTQAITRAEFCAFAVALYENIKGEITGSTTFTDTNDINVQKAAFIGVVTGVNTELGLFDPNAQLTREQAAVMLSRLANAIGKPFPASAPNFTDTASISSWAIDGVGGAQDVGIMGSTSTESLVFSPQGAYTREQSIVTIVRLLDYLK